MAAGRQASPDGGATRCPPHPQAAEAGLARPCTRIRPVRSAGPCCPIRRRRRCRAGSPFRARATMACASCSACKSLWMPSCPAAASILLACCRCARGRPAESERLPVERANSRRFRRRRPPAQAPGWALPACLAAAPRCGQPSSCADPLAPPPRPAALIRGTACLPQQTHFPTALGPSPCPPHPARAAPIPRRSAPHLSAGTRLSTAALQVWPDQRESEVRDKGCAARRWGTDHSLQACLDGWGEEMDGARHGVAGGPQQAARGLLSSAAPGPVLLGRQTSLDPWRRSRRDHVAPEGAAGGMWGRGGGGQACIGGGDGAWAVGGTACC